MDALRAVVVALSLLGVAIIYSDIVEDEAALPTQESESTPSVDINVEAILSGELLTGESGSFESPNYPTANHKLDYVWLIKVEPTKAVRLVLIDFDTETGFDYIIVHDGDSTEHPVLLVHSGNSVPRPIRSTNNKMLVRFVTNNKGTSRGFHANYFAVSSCFNAIQSSSGLIASPSFPFSYDSNMRCEWLITVGNSERILFEFLDVNTEKDYDVIQIYDGDNDGAPLLQRISGDHRTDVLFQVSTSNVVLVSFTTDGSISENGFAAKFTAGNHADLMQYFMEEYPDFFEDSEVNAETEEEKSAGQEIKTMIADAMMMFYEEGLKSSNITNKE
ncbi:dorsal-ventral patterning tolloid-like protein 1 [Daphnia carinata]|uniref:dorsal-ventral patterning tolloid-like protein 1 n=1 Tax=Daphnia carinata TaxID=120202 RepID=UPI00257FD832|nr:dorsal-ventral patterning tolloid-like protein 1 [Daphnia carinata]